MIDSLVHRVRLLIILTARVPVRALAKMKSRREHSSDDDDWSPPPDPLPIYQQRYNYLTWRGSVTDRFVPTRSNLRHFSKTNVLPQQVAFFHNFFDVEICNFIHRTVKSAIIISSGQINLFTKMCLPFLKLPWNVVALQRGFIKRIW